MAFVREKHIKYWRMNASLLPQHYISSDSSRMTLGYFIVAALDLLDALDIVAKEERQGWIDWIYTCQCPGGGFRGFTGTVLDQNRNQQNAVWDPPNIPATFFALTALLVLGDDLERVNRDQCLGWLPKVQRTDGSFGEVLAPEGVIEGGRDLRFCCCAAGIAYMLQSIDPEGMNTTTINVKAMVEYVRSCRNYNGGFGESPLKEPHSGLTYCAVATLAFAQKLDIKSTGAVLDHLSILEPAIRWMLERQTDVLDEEEEEELDQRDDNQTDETNVGQNSMSEGNETDMSVMEQSIKFKIPTIAGFNGREGKIADTCYCFWNVGALTILNSTNFIDSDAMKKYLLEQTQHMIGGFGKGPGAPPGLAALSLIGEKGLKPVDPGLCISQEAAKRLSNLRWKKKNNNTG